MVDYGLSGKVALVTGVSRHMGIGAAIAHSLAASGANVFTTYYRSYDKLMPWGSNSHEAEEIIESLKLQGVKAAGVEVNLAESEMPKKLFDQIGELITMIT